MRDPQIPFLTSDQVARWLGLPVRTVTDWAVRWRDTDGEEGIPGFKLGRSWRFDPQKLVQWIADRQQAGLEPADSYAKRRLEAMMVDDGIRH